MVSLSWPSPIGDSVVLLSLILSSLPICQASKAGGQMATGAISADSSHALEQCSKAMDSQLPLNTPSNFHFSGNIRRYYVQAEEVTWDYAPTGWDNWLGVPFNQSIRAQNAGATQYGTKWLKALYRGYTDASFSEQTEQAPTQGTQGPTLRAEVGDLIEILFHNKLSKNYASMHSMGLAYSKSSEGSNYANATLPGQNVILPTEDAVPPGQCVVYKWMVNDPAGPGGGAPAKTHSYHSYVSLQQDANTGLIGPTIIYAAGKMASTMTGYREFPILYNIYTESLSWLSGQNNARLTGNSSALPGKPNTSGLPAGNETVWLPQITNIQDANGFSDAPAFYALNGYIFANSPTYEMCLNDKVIWYVNAYGQDSHVFHMHGNGYSYLNTNGYAAGVNDGVGKTLYMDAVGQGQWQVVCHVQDHQEMGMVAKYRVYPEGECPLKPLEPC